MSTRNTKKATPAPKTKAAPKKKPTTTKVEPEVLKIDELVEQGTAINEGLGDTIAKVTEFFGIKPCDKCIERKKFLNKKYTSLELSRDVTEEEVLFMEKLNKRPGYIESEDINPLFNLYNSLFNKTLRACRCGSVIAQIVRILNNSFKAHKDENIT